MRSKPDNLWVNLTFNAVLPALILAFLSKEDRLGPVGGLVLALAFPFGYGLYDLAYRRTWNLLSILGFVSTLLTGGLGLLKMHGAWFAVKEAALPLVVAAAIPLSLRTRQPLVRTLLYNDQVLDTGRIHEALVARNNLTSFEQLLAAASWLLAGAMALSAMVNFALALWLLPAESGTAEFNLQLGKLQFWSWPGTVLPSSIIVFYALFRLLRGVEHLTGLKGDELFHAKTKKA
ncbi:MAG: MFS transporter [Verrucomicrobia bacterium]|nr:MFS transporter [Verrucomicrobiota bacterium]